MRRERVKHAAREPTATLRNAIDGRDDVTQVTDAVQYPDDDSSRDSTRLDVLSRGAGAAHLSRRDVPRRSSRSGAGRRQEASRAHARVSARD